MRSTGFVVVGVQIHPQLVVVEVWIRPERSRPRRRQRHRSISVAELMEWWVMAKATSVGGVTVMPQS
jgi:hypothetical protein